MGDDSADRIRKRRIALNMSMDALAEKTGYTSTTRKTAIYHIEKRYNEVPLFRLPAFSKALKTNVLYLLGMIEAVDLTDDEIIALIQERYPALNIESLDGANDNEK